MAAIGKIRKHGVALMIIIGIALLAFIVGDLTHVIPSITNRYLVVQVNDNKVRYDRDNTYQTYYEQNRLLFSFLQDNISGDEDFDAQIHEYTWEQFKHETLLDEQLNQLGMGFSDEMIEGINEKLTSSLKSQPTNNAEYYLFSVAQKFVQQGASGEQIIQAFENINDYRGQGDIYNIYKAIERIAVMDAKENTYFGLAANSLYFSKSLMEQMNKDNDKISVNLASIDINNPAFDNLKIEVSDNEAKEYFKAHKDHFTTHTTVRDIDFAVVPIAASETDAKAVKDTVDAIYNRFQQSANINDFAQNEVKIDRKRVFNYNAAQQNLHNVFNYDYKKASFAQIDTALYLERGKTAYAKFYTNEQNPPRMPAALDSFIYTHGAGTFISPAMYENGIYYFGKINAVAVRPDSIQVIGLAVDFKVEGNENSKSTRTKEDAKTLADSIANAINGQPMSAATALMSKYPNAFGNDTTFWFTDLATDTTSHNLYNNLMATANGQTYVFTQEQNGVYIVFQVMDKRAFMEKRQYVLYPVPVRISNETDKLARAKANNISKNSPDVAKMNEIAQKESAILVHGTDVTNMQSSVSLDNFNFMLMCRPAISWAFDEDKKIQNKTNQVSTTVFKGQIYHFNQMTGERIVDNDAYIIAGIKSIVKAQDPKFEDVKDRVIAEVKAEKRAAAVEEQLKKELAGSNMAALATKYQARVDSMNINFSEFNQMLETAVVGKIAGLPADGKANIVSSKNRVYLAAVQKVEKNTQPMNENAMMNSAFMTTLKQRLQQGDNLITIVKSLVYNDLQNDAKIVDRRHVFYKSN